ncbi:MAG: hypothetical protein JNM31_01060 [Flavobacteriales bacterium]|nr:hypothetical protein [Flavobacteriales bacterium]
MSRIAGLLFALALTISNAPGAVAGGGDDQLRMQVECTRTSAFVNLTIENERRIGKVVIEVRDKEGRLWYREAGKAYTGTLVRRLDKGTMPKGELTLTVHARHLAITQTFQNQ